MFERSARDNIPPQKGIAGKLVQSWKELMGFVLFLAAGLLAVHGQNNPAAPGFSSANSSAQTMLTNAAQLKQLSVSDCLSEGSFRLQGVVTLVDTNRNFLVLQDATGPLALHFDLSACSVQAGQEVLLEGTNFYPYVVSFPDYPFHPSVREMLTLFEGPSEWGEYYLARYRGWLRPPVTGEYTFWIASDNSSELWLSPDATPSKARKIAFISDFGWAKPREWSKFPSQRSEAIRLEAGTTYYIEARHEQTTKNDNLAVAWSGPGLEQSVIDGRYLAAWSEGGEPNPVAPTNGILREYWTNYSAGNLSILAGPIHSESAFSVQRVKVSIVGQGRLPDAEQILLGQPLPPDKNFGRVRTEGVVRFFGINGHSARLELADGEARIQVRALRWDAAWGTNLDNARVQVEGVCEGGHDQNGVLMPGVIWSSGDNFLALSQPADTNASTMLPVPDLQPVLTNADLVIEGFYATRGVVTFNDHVLGRDCMFVQGDSTAIAISLKGRRFENHLVVGQELGLGGTLHPGKYVPTMAPMVVTLLGWHSLPEPVSQPLHFPVPASRDGLWTEIEGVVRSVNANGTMTVRFKEGLIYLWVGQIDPHDLNLYEDAKLRVRGVLSLTLLDAPTLLIPSRSFVEVEEAAPPDPFKIPLSSVAGLPADALDASAIHRARVQGGVTYVRGRRIFLQDNSGGLQVLARDEAPVNVGDTLEVAGFPEAGGSARLLTEALVRVTGDDPHLQPKPLNLAETLLPRQKATLVQVSATLVNQKNTPVGQLLELEEHQRIFTATLAGHESNLPSMAPGSQVKVTGVFEDGAIDLPAEGKGNPEITGAGSLNLLLRNPADVILLQGPPWWTLKRTLALVGTLVTVLLVALLWVYLLGRRLARQQAARLAFSRQILQGQESERQRIAVNLHDSLGQDLLVIKNQARLAMQSTGDEADRQNRLRKISEITSQAIEEVRQITHDLRPYQLDRLGLTQAIRTVVNQAAENSPVLIATSLDPIDGIFSKDSEIHVYRIVQEALNNIVKHSAATEAAIVIKCLAAEVALSIRDNGCGFDAELAGSTSAQGIGYGLIGMRERARILDGRFEIDSRPTQGTIVTIEIPKPVFSNSPA